MLSPVYVQFHQKYYSIGEAAQRLGLCLTYEGSRLDTLFRSQGKSELLPQSGMPGRYLVDI